MMPGRTLHRLATHLCSAKTLERVVEPAIADVQKEYAAAEFGSSLRRARILFVGYLAILEVTLMCALQSSAATDVERHALVRTLLWSLALMIAVTGTLMLPPLSAGGRSVRSSAYLVGLIPQAVPLAIPIGLTFGIAFGLAGRAATRAMMKVVLLIALAASLVCFVTLVWVMPAANQAYRESVTRATGLSSQLIKGASEMTLSELDREVAVAAAVGNRRRANGYAWSFHLRFALSAASVALAAFLFATAGSRAAFRGLLAFAACFAYWALIHVGEGLAVYSPVAPAVAGTIPVFVGAWLPNIVLIGIAIVIASSRFNRRSA